MSDEKQSKAQAVRDYLSNHRNPEPKKVVSALSEQGIIVTAAYVSKIKSKSRKTKSSSARKTDKSTPAKQWTFPKNTLEDAIQIPKSIEEKNAGKPMPAKDLPKIVGYKQVLKA